MDIPSLLFLPPPTPPGSLSTAKRLTITNIHRYLPATLAYHEETTYGVAVELRHGLLNRSFLRDTAVQVSMRP